MPFFSVILLSLEEDLEKVHKLANRIRDAIEHMTIDNVNITISGGIASKQKSLDKTFELADEALYESKNRGKNQITIYSSEMTNHYHDFDDVIVVKHKSD